MSKSSPHEAQCAACPIRNRDERRCMHDQGKYPPNCPTVHHKDRAEEALKKYFRDDTLFFAQTATRVECAGYIKNHDGSSIPSRPRIVEIIDFAQRMSYQKLGLVFCMGLINEARIVHEILEANDFSVASAICKVGGIPKSDLGIARQEQLDPGSPETMCNPIMQADLMNEAAVDFNILLGLCVGHDTMALQALKSPATILAVKDRLMGHNPLAAIYTSASYYKFLKKPLKAKD